MTEYLLLLMVTPTKSILVLIWQKYAQVLTILLEDDSLCHNDEDYAKAAQTIKDFGNTAFRASQFKTAIDKYEKVRLER